MNDITWTKHMLAHSLNTRMEQKRIPGDDFIMANDISDDALRVWQEFYDGNKSNPTIVEAEYGRVYQSIVGGW